MRIGPPVAEWFKLFNGIQDACTEVVRVARVVDRPRAVSEQDVDLGHTAGWHRSSREEVIDQQLKRVGCISDPVAPDGDSCLAGAGYAPPSCLLHELLQTPGERAPRRWADQRLGAKRKCCAGIR